MTIPQTLRIGGHTFRVRQMHMDSCGELDRGTNTILLADHLSPSMRESTFFHELFHALNNELDHALLDSLAEQLYQVLSDNSMLR